MSEVKEVDNLQIPELERQNLKELINRLEESAERQRYKINTEIVGGAVQKEWPRKDIDLVCKTSGPMLEGPQNSTSLSRAKFFLGVLEDIVRGAVSSSQFEIVEVKKPYEDREFNDMNILAHDGSIVIKPGTGTQIELINGNV